MVASSSSLLLGVAEQLSSSDMSTQSRKAFTLTAFTSGDCDVDKRTRFNMLPQMVNSNSAMEQRNAAWGKNDYKDRKDWTCVGGPGGHTQGIPGMRYG